MSLPKKVVVVVLISGLLIVLFFLARTRLNNPGVLSSSIGPTLTAFESNDFTLVFVGDSMTEYLGNFESLREDFKKYYPGKKFLLLNYGYGSTNILSVEERLTKTTQHVGRDFQAINEIPFDLILIESFGNNPLSEYPLEEGLKKQTEALDRIVEIITKSHPSKSVVFVSTLAPNKNRFGEGVVQLDAKAREQWVSEREEYLKNHIKYAESHSIPLINIYTASLDKDGTGNIDYLSSQDFIHPSATGIIFISNIISQFIFDNRLL